MGADTRIVRAAIHPGIGMARVGNSPTEFFIGPEVPYPTGAPAGSHHDAKGAVKRQAARFRVYGLNAAGEVVKELTLDHAHIRWVVHVANRKAAWYNFEVPLDIPEALACKRRNAKISGANRQRLIIDPGAREISGRDASGARFDSGQFWGRRVYLGELRTDDAGRLLFLGGRGVAGTPFQNNPVHTYANNDGWYDDISDGPVTAEVILDGERLPVEHAWVVVAPPNYAPDLVTLQTLYDVVDDAFQRAGQVPRPAVSFTQHIFPILTQLCEAQWVNLGFHHVFGWRQAQDFLQPEFLAQLASNDPQLAGVRAEVFYQFRRPYYEDVEVAAWPQIYGDAAFLSTKETNPRYLLAITPTQYDYLRQWAAGLFEADWNPAAPTPTVIEDVPLQAQPHTLDKAALHFCMGAPFHPGCELTWPMRQVSMYRAPFRIRAREAHEPAPDLGPILTAQNVWTDLGPLKANAPGDLTRWMAIPWQTDTASCRSGYEPQYDPYLPTFWPARVPNHVLTTQDYQRLMDVTLSLEERQQIFNTRHSWFRGLRGNYQAQINQMVMDWAKMGVIEAHVGPTDVEGLFPLSVFVESPTDWPTRLALSAAEGGSGDAETDAFNQGAIVDLGADNEKLHHLRRLTNQGPE